MGLGNIGSWFKSQYDKMTAFVVLACLLASLLYLVVRIGTMAGEQKRFEDEINRLKPKNPAIADVDISPLKVAGEKLVNPFQLGSWSNSVFVPEIRVMCVDARCKRPILMDATNCPFCLMPQPDEDEILQKDTDNDGMPDEWEKQHKFDLSSASDATKDADGDGFINVVEYTSKTHPRDAASHPTWESLIHIVSIKPLPFELKFKGTAVMPDGTIKFQINLRRNERAFIVRMGEEVQEFKVIDFVAKKRREHIKGIGEADVDVSELTLQTGEEKIVLVLDKEVKWTKSEATLEFDLDKSKQVVRKGSTYTLKRKDSVEKYTVSDVDIEQGSVVLLRADGKKFEIRKARGNDIKASPENEK